jgi:hypothetical protein
METVSKSVGLIVISAGIDELLYRLLLPKATA